MIVFRSKNKKMIMSCRLWISPWLITYSISIFLGTHLFAEGAIAAPSSQKALAYAHGKISKIGQATHLEISGLKSWDYTLSRSGKATIKIDVPALNEKLLNQLKAWNGDLIKNIVVLDKTKNGRNQLVLQLSNSKVESFDYLTDKPSRLIIDFYTAIEKAKKVITSKGNMGSVGNTKIKTKTNTNTKKRGKLPAKVLKGLPKKTKLKSGVSKKGYKVKNRRPASNEFLVIQPTTEPQTEKGFPKSGVYDGADDNYNRFRVKNYEISETSIIASADNLYIEFPMLSIQSVRLDELLENPPLYSILPKDSKENEEARFLLILNRRGRLAAYVKAFGLFRAKYPKSEYDEILTNVVAEVYQKLYIRDGHKRDLESFEKSYEYLLNRYPKSVMAGRINLILGFTKLQLGDGYEALRIFQNYLKKYPGSLERDDVQMAMGSALLMMKDYKHALLLYNDMEKGSLKTKTKVEANFRKGDVLFLQKKYPLAIKHYVKSLKKFPNFRQLLPNLDYNLAESYFWNRKYKKALDHYVGFVERFPSHPYCSYVITRIGEVMGILGAGKSKSLGTYLESYYRFKGSEGANVARVRMLSARMTSMKKKEMKKSLEEMDEIRASSKLPSMNEFVTLLVSDGLFSRKEYGRGLKKLTSYYQNNPTAQKLNLIKKHIIKNIVTIIKHDTEQGDFLNALKTENKYKTTWLRDTGRTDITYLVGQAYEQSGVLVEARKKYEKVFSEIKAMAGSQLEKEKRVNEYLPTLSNMKLRLAAVSLKERLYKKAQSYLAKINVSKLGPREQTEYIELSADVAIHRFQYDQGKIYLKKLLVKWKHLNIPLDAIHLKLAYLQFLTQEYDEALLNIGRVEDNRGAGKATNDDLWANTLKLKGDILAKTKQTKKALDVYFSLLDQFESKRPLASVRFRAGELLYADGDIVNAEKVWNTLKDKNQMYYKLGQEKLRQAIWDKDYKKYIRRIPATAGMK